MKTLKGADMFIIQPRDLVRITNVSGEELGVAGLLGRIAPSADMLVWGQTFTHCGLHKDWARDRLAVEKIDVRVLSLAQIAQLNRHGSLGASDVKGLEPEEAAAKPQKAEKKAEKKAEPEPEPAPEPEPEPAPEPEPEPAPEPEPETEPEPEPEPEPAPAPEPEAEEQPKAKKKRTRKKKSGE